MFYLIAVIIWFICGFISYGLGVAYWQGKFGPRSKEKIIEDMKSEFVIALFGPISLASTLVFQRNYGFYGFKLK